MRTLSLLLLIFSLQSLARADPAAGDWKHRAYLMAGEYTVIGRRADSKKLYFGHLSLHAKGDKLEFVKTINEVTVRGMASIDSDDYWQYEVLRLKFVQKGELFEGLFQFSIDCKKAFRFTGVLGSKNTEAGGLEAWFPDK
jgi:hypothetical protein